MEKPVETSVPLHEVVRRRWSPRAFSSRPVDGPTLLSLLEAARWAPSSSNEQPWSFIVFPKENAAAFDAFVQCLNPGNQVWAKEAPLLILTTTRIIFERSERPNRHSFHDAGLALANLTFQAVSMGLFAHPMAGFNIDKARKDFQLPPAVEPVAAVAVGYPGDPNELPEDVKAKELAPRSRRPLSEIVFEGTWGLPSLAVTSADPTPTRNGHAQHPAPQP